MGDGAHPRGPFGDILCGVDGSPGGYAAVAQAAALAGPGARITLLAVTSFRSAGAGRSPELQPLHAKEILDEAVRIADDAHVATTIEVDPAAPPADVILRWAAERDLLAMGAPTTPWLGGIVGGGPVAAAVGELATPLLIARAHPTPERAPGPVLVASDGLVGSDGLVELAGRLADVRGSDLHLVHAAQRRQHAHEHPRIARQRESLGRLTFAAGEARIESGGARSLILDAASRLDASLVVMGSRRLHGPRTIGSVSRHIAHHAACSVLLVPPERLQA